MKPARGVGSASRVTSRRASMVKCTVAVVFVCLTLAWGGPSEDDGISGSSSSVRGAPGGPQHPPSWTPVDQSPPTAASPLGVELTPVASRDRGVDGSSSDGTSRETDATSTAAVATGDVPADSGDAPQPATTTAAARTAVPATPAPEWAWVADATTLNASINCAAGATAPSVSLDFYRQAPKFRALHKLHLATRRIVMQMADILPHSIPRGAPADAEALRELRKSRSRAIKASVAIVRPNPASANATTPSGIGFRHGPWGYLFEPRVAIRTPVKRQVPGAPLRTMADALDRFQFELEQDVAKVLTEYAGQQPTVKAVFDLGARTYNASLATAEVRSSAYSSSLRVLEEHVPGFDSADVYAFELDQQYIASFAAFVERRRARGATGAFRLYAAAAWANADGIVMGGSSSMKSTADGCGHKGGECTCFPSQDVPAMLERYPPRSVVLKMDIEGAEWVVVKSIIDRGVADRIAILFLECHGPRSTSGVPARAHSKENWFEPPVVQRQIALPVLMQVQWWQSVSGLGAECYLLHDMLRSHGIATYEWP